MTKITVHSQEIYTSNPVTYLNGTISYVPLDDAHRPYLANALILAATSNTFKEAVAAVVKDQWKATVEARQAASVKISKYEGGWFGKLRYRDVSALADEFRVTQLLVVDLWRVLTFVYEGVQEGGNDNH